MIGAMAAKSEVIARLAPMARFFASSGISLSKKVNCPSTNPALVMPPQTQSG